MTITCLLMLLGITGSASAAETPDVSLSTNVVVGYTSAKLEGSVDTHGEEAAIYAEYATQATGPFTYEYVETIPEGTTGATPIAAEVIGLEAGTEYFFRLDAEVAGVGETYSPEPYPSATTKSAEGPSVRLETPTVSGGVVELSGDVNPNASEAAPASPEVEAVSETHWQFICRPECPGLLSGTVPADTVAHHVAAEAKDLLPATTYEVELFAENSGGSETAGPLTVVTSALPPEVGGELPDGRVYEQISPVAKNGTDATGYPYLVQAAPGGEAIRFISLSGIPGGVGAQEFPYFLSSRSASGWSTQGLLPPASYAQGAEVQGMVPDFSAAIENVLRYRSGVSEEALVYRDAVTGSLEEIQPFSTELRRIYFQGASSDGSEVFFQTRESGLEHLDVWSRSDQSVHAVGILPDGSAAPGGSFAGPYAWLEGNTGGGGNFYFVQEAHAISDSGSRVFFTAGGTAQLYLRTNPTRSQSALGPDGQCIEGLQACTIQLSSAEPGVSDPNGPQPAAFMEATPDGSAALFTSAEKLTGDATTGPADEGKDLYLWRADGNPRLIDLSASQESGPEPAGAEVQGVLGMSPDSSYVYFAANGVLGEGATEGASPGTCEKSAAGGGHWEGDCNLYLWHAGHFHFIARLTSSSPHATGDYTNWTPASTSGNLLEKTARVAHNGTLLFSSVAPLTGFENLGYQEFFRYRPGDPGPTCISCDPSGTSPVNNASMKTITALIGPGRIQSPLTRNLSASGNRIFFNSPDKLVSADVNGEDGCPLVGPSGERVPSCQDVYEWETRGSGTCTEADPGYSGQSGGCLYLISTGSSHAPSFFADADSEGTNAFFFTRQSLVGQDKDQLQDIYDARVGGGIAAQNPPPPTTCTGEAGCKPPVAPAPPSSAPATVNADGQGNLNPRRQCSSLGHRANRIGHRAAELRHRARRLSDRSTSKRLRRKAGHLAKRARRLSGQAKSCRGHAEPSHSGKAYHHKRTDHSNRRTSR